MSLYQRIVFGLDLQNTLDVSALAKVTALAKMFGASLTIVHAIEQYNIYDIEKVYPDLTNLEEKLLEQASLALAKVCADFAIPIENQVVELGLPRTILLKYANLTKADLIVLGSHGRQGMRFITSNANAVFHHSRVDVMAIVNHSAK